MFYVQATVYKYNKLQKETTSLQAVCDLRGEEARTLRNELAKVRRLDKKKNKKKQKHTCWNENDSSVMMVNV